MRIRSLSNDYMMSIGDGRIIVDATYEGIESRFINHSCDVNAYYRTVQMESIDIAKVVAVYALCGISAESEIRANYGWGFSWDGVTVEICECGTSRCTGIAGYSLQ